MASLRRLRQTPPNFGSTCYVEITASFGAATDQKIFHDSEKLLAAVRYHGIFGIEWLYERATGKFYLIDFNARPFLTIGHLFACGLNLPALAYRELTGRLPATVNRLPALRHIIWMDALRDMGTLMEVETNVLTALAVWTIAAWRCRSFAYQSWRDPLPGIAQMLHISRVAVCYFARKMTGTERRARARIGVAAPQDVRRTASPRT